MGLNAICDLKEAYFPLNLVLRRSGSSFVGSFFSSLLKFFLDHECRSPNAPMLAVKLAKKQPFQ
jgi:hypothetical protein